MDKTKIIDLKRKIFLRSALIPIDGLQEVFELNENFSGDELLGELFKKSLRAWEYHHPLIWESKVYKDQLCSCEVIGEGYCKIQSNFDLYLKCLISEDQIILVPNVTPKVRSYRIISISRKLFYKYNRLSTSLYQFRRFSR